MGGVKAGFDVTIMRVRLRRLPELNDAFAGKIRPGLTSAELKQEVENTVGGQEEDKTTDTVHQEEKALAERLTSTLPVGWWWKAQSSASPSCSRRCATLGPMMTPLKQMISPEGFQKYLKVVRPKVVTELRGKLAVESIGRSIGVQADEQQVEEQMATRSASTSSRRPIAGAAFNEEKAREKVTYELQRVAVLDKVRDQAKITYVDALSPEETARKMGIDVDNLPPEVQLGVGALFPALVSEPHGGGGVSMAGERNAHGQLRAGVELFGRGASRPVVSWAGERHRRNVRRGINTVYMSSPGAFAVAAHLSRRQIRRRSPVTQRAHVIDSRLAPMGVRGADRLELCSTLVLGECLVDIGVARSAELKAAIGPPIFT